MTTKPVFRRPWIQFLVLVGLNGLWVLYVIAGMGVVRERSPSPAAAPMSAPGQPTR